MRRVDLDFCKANAGSNSSGGLLFLLMGLLSAGWIVNIHNDTRVEQQRIRSALAQRQGPSPQRITAGSTDQATKQQFQRAALVIEQLSFPWNKLFQAIEESAGEDIALLSVQPDMSGKTIVFDAEAKQWGSMVSYIKRLEEDPFFADVHLISHQIQQSDPQRSVRFQLSCTWVMPSIGAPSPISGGAAIPMAASASSPVAVVPAIPIEGSVPGRIAAGAAIPMAASASSPVAAISAIPIEGSISGRIAAGATIPTEASASSPVAAISAIPIEGSVSGRIAAGIATPIAASASSAAHSLGQ